MKKFTIEVSHATSPQLQTIGLELKIMSNGWAKHGPRILINGSKLEAPSLYEPRHKAQAKDDDRPLKSGHKRHNFARFI